MPTKKLITTKFSNDFDINIVTKTISNHKKITITQNSDCDLLFVSSFTLRFVKKFNNLIIYSGENPYYTSMFKYSKLNLYNLSMDFIRIFPQLKKFIMSIIYVIPAKILLFYICKSKRFEIDLVKKLIKDNPENSLYYIGSKIDLPKPQINYTYPLFINFHRLASPNFIKSFKRTSSIDNKKFCCMIVSNPMSYHRNYIAYKLNKYKKVDIFGNCFLKNTNRKISNKSADNHIIFSEYKFVICCENSVNDDYITEKLPEAFCGGTIPIYYGAPNVANYFNTKAFIEYNSLNKSLNKMIDKIIQLDNDESEYFNYIRQPIFTQQNMLNIDNKKQGLKNFLNSVIDAI